MEARTLTCIVCPMGCLLNVEVENDKIGNISGNRCKRGSAYAVEECTAPKRMLTTTVRISGGIHPLLPVKTKKAIPKALIRPCMEEIRGVQVSAPVRAGDIIVKNICGTGVDIIATRSIPHQN
jgi:CxxC motif-containing protein